jgi:DNA-binding response OmpR family regulator
MATILAVDDDESVRNLLAETLRLAGHDVVTAENGEQALHKLKRRPFDLMILDIMMPGLDGYAVLEQLPEIPARAGMPVIVLTAKHDPDGVMREMKAGAVDHIVKPFGTLELEEAVVRALDEDGVAAAHRRRTVSNDAEVYGSMAFLFAEARSGSDH